MTFLSKNNYHLPFVGLCNISLYVMTNFTSQTRFDLPSRAVNSPELIETLVVELSGLNLPCFALIFGDIDLPDVMKSVLVKLDSCDSPEVVKPSLVKLAWLFFKLLCMSVVRILPDWTIALFLKLLKFFHLIFHSNPELPPQKFLSNRAPPPHPS